jgi:hypothetical protein
MWKHIVCYGLGHFHGASEEQIQETIAWYIRHGFTEERARTGLARSYVKSSKQLEFLKQLQHKHRGIPVFVYDPVFTETETSMLRSLGWTVLDTLYVFGDSTLYYMPYLPVTVSTAIWNAHVKGDRIGIIGNTHEFVLPNVPCVVTKRARTCGEYRLYEEEYITIK